MRVGDRVNYKGVMYFVISIMEDGACKSLDMIEIAPTRHGAGSFYVTCEYLDLDIKGYSE